MVQEKVACRICGGNVVEVDRIFNYPLVAGPVLVSNMKIDVCDVVVGVCLECGLYQLIEPPASDVKYDEAYRSSNPGAGSTDKKTIDFVALLERAGISSGSKVLEIGCYDGSLLQRITSTFDAEVYGCDPCPMAAVAAEAGFNVKQEEFSAGAFEKGSFDFVVLRNVLEHVPTPVEFLKDVTTVLKKDAKVILDIPNGEMRISSGIVGSIVPQHQIYFGASTLSKTLAMAGLSGKLYLYKGGLRAIAKKRVRQPSLLSGQQDQFRASGGTVRSRRVTDVTEALKDVEKFSVFGANTCTVELVASGAVDPLKVTLVVDDDPLKWGKRLVGTELIVRPRDEIERGGAVLVCSYYSQGELVGFLLERGCKPLCLYPTVHWR